MATPIAMPKLGMTMREGRVVSWVVPVGGRVEKNAPVLVIESEKAEVEIEAAAAGILRHVWVAADETVPCGTLLGVITATRDEPFDADAFRRAHDRPEVPRRPPPPPAATAPGAPAAAPRRPLVTPAARALAKQLEIDPSSVPGSGPGGRVTREDVQAVAERRRALVNVAEGVRLEVPASGEGDPVVLLPGFGTDVAVFSRQVLVLAATHRVLGVNPRGVGLSDAPPGQRYEVARAAADVAALPGAPAHVIGASLGAAVAIELALEHRERVRSLTLVTPFVTASPRLLAVVGVWSRLAAETSPDLLAEALLPWLCGPRTLADDAARARTRRGLADIATRVPPATLARSEAGLRAWSGTRVDAVGRIDVPTLVIGAGEDLLTPEAAAVARAIPKARLVMVSDAGHAVGLEAHEAVNEAILAHLAKA